MSDSERLPLKELFNVMPKPYCDRLVQDLRGVIASMHDVSPENFREEFFRRVLLTDMNGLTSSIVFRLAELISPEERRQMRVWPGPPIPDTLEDFYQFYKRFKGEDMPTLADLWPESRNYLPLFDTSK